MEFFPRAAAAVARIVCDADTDAFTALDVTRYPFLAHILHDYLNVKFKT